MAVMCDPTPCDINLDSAGIVTDITDFLNPGAGCEDGIPMGLGQLGTGNIIFKRKFRWTFDMQYCCDPGPIKEVSPSFVKMGARPNIEFEEIEINYLNAKTWIPGKGTWQPITITYYDVAGPTASATTVEVLNWIATIYDISDPVCLKMNSRPASYEGIGRLVLYDGCGQPLEVWLLKHCWPQAVNWGELDMASSDECTIEITLRYAEVCYKSFCPDQDLDPCACTPCTEIQ